MQNAASAYPECAIICLVHSCVSTVPCLSQSTALVAHPLQATDCLVLVLEDRQTSAAHMQVDGKGAQCNRAPSMMPLLRVCQPQYQHATLSCPVEVLAEPLKLSIQG